MNVVEDLVAAAACRAPRVLPKRLATIGAGTATGVAVCVAGADFAMKSLRLGWGEAVAVPENGPRLVWKAGGAFGCERGRFEAGVAGGRGGLLTIFYAGYASLVNRIADCAR